MITDKILIFAPYEYNINGGGPSGFIAHNLVDKPRDFFLLSHDFFEDSLLDRINIKIKYLIDRYQYLSYHYKKIKGGNYKYVYFHDYLSFEHCRRYIPNNQVVILQSHSPELPSEEYRADFPNDIAQIKFVEQAQKRAFERADIVVFPNEGCVPIYESILQKTSDIKFILSGAKKGLHSEALQHEALRDDKINLMYIGRRNAIKGFDIVLDAYRKIYQQRKDINLIVVGKGEPIQEEGIVDVGFSSNPIGWYNSVDYLINANRQSYFDLSIIEALSTGVPIIMSSNYGHKYYENKSALIHTFNAQNPDELKTILLGNLHKRNFDLKDNQELYLNNLTDTHYYERFKNFALSLF